MSEGEHKKVECSKETLDALFYTVQTEHGFVQDVDIDRSLLKVAQDAALKASIPYNYSPLRVIYIHREKTSHKSKLLRCLLETNKEQTSQAPTTAILCFETDHDKNIPSYDIDSPEFQQRIEQDEEFKAEYESNEELRRMLKEDPEMANDIMIQNGNLQAGYFIMALRALGLGVGPMGGFSAPAVKSIFLRDSTLTPNFLVNIGIPVIEKRYPRAPRLDFDDCAKIL